LVLFRPGWDRFVMSPGHYIIAAYAIAAELGLIDPCQLATYGADGSLLKAIGTERTPIVDLTCGKLGPGLSGAIGFAIAARLAGEDRRTFASLSDGEMEEGQVWEAAMFASHHAGRIGPLTVVIEANNSQVDGPVNEVTTIEPLVDNWRAFGWRTVDCDGHDPAALTAALAGVRRDSTPLAIIARTHILGRLRSIPPMVDGHFIKLDPALRSAVVMELEAQHV
jgi:transketolase